MKAVQEVQEGRGLSYKYKAHVVADMNVFDGMNIFDSPLMVIADQYCGNSRPVLW